MRHGERPAAGTAQHTTALGAPCYADDGEPPTLSGICSISWSAASRSRCVAGTCARSLRKEDCGMQSSGAAMGGTNQLPHTAARTRHMRCAHTAHAGRQCRAVARALMERPNKPLIPVLTLAAAPPPLLRSLRCQGPAPVRQGTGPVFPRCSRRCRCHRRRRRRSAAAGLAAAAAAGARAAGCCLGG